MDYINSRFFVFRMSSFPFNSHFGYPDDWLAKHPDSFEAKMYRKRKVGDLLYGRSVRRRFAVRRRRVGRIARPKSYRKSYRRRYKAKRLRFRRSLRGKGKSMMSARLSMKLPCTYIPKIFERRVFHYSSSNHLVTFHNKLDLWRLAHGAYRNVYYPITPDLIENWYFKDGVTCTGGTFASRNYGIWGKNPVANQSAHSKLFIDHYKYYLKYIRIKLVLTNNISFAGSVRVYLVQRRQTNVVFPTLVTSSFNDWKPEAGEKHADQIIQNDPPDFAKYRILKRWELWFKRQPVVVKDVNDVVETSLVTADPLGTPPVVPSNNGAAYPVAVDKAYMHSLKRPMTRREVDIEMPINKMVYTRDGEISNSSYGGTFDDAHAWSDFRDYSKTYPVIIIQPIPDPQMSETYDPPTNDINMNLEVYTTGVYNFEKQ